MFLFDFKCDSYHLYDDKIIITGSICVQFMLTLNPRTAKTNQASQKAMVIDFNFVWITEIKFKESIFFH